ncbi:MAG: ABC transporter permease [Chloroflexota bacterium]
MADLQPAPTVAVEPPTRDSARRAAAVLAGRWDMVLRLGLLGIIIVLAAYFAVRSPVFLSSDNLQNIGRQMAVFGVIAVGETFVIITAGIDLSVGSVLGITGLVCALELSHGWPLAAAIVIPLALGCGIGVFNGVLIDTQKLPPFIVTLGMLGILRGLTEMMGGGVDITFNPSGFTDFGIGITFGIPNLFLVLVGVCVVSAVILHFTRLGRHIYALGSNSEGARLAGINVRWTTIFVYAMSGFLAAIAGILLTSRLSLGDPNSGTGYELDAISAAVLGGASLFGARGTIVGTFMGVLLVNMIANGINLLNVDAFFSRVVEGALLIAVVWVDQWRKRRLAQ